MYFQGLFRRMDENPPPQTGDRSIPVTLYRFNQSFLKKIRGGQSGGRLDKESHGV